MSARRLPRFVSPMLAKIGEPFDSDEHLFEIKWDGLRTLAFIEEAGVRLMSRRGADTTERFPELAGLGHLSPGTVLDGEIIVARDGRSSFHDVLAREQARDPGRIARLVRTHPVAYVVFDILYGNGRSVMPRPLVERRALLEETVGRDPEPPLLLSDYVVGRGRSFYAEACRQELEGVMAKRLRSRYLAGRRSDAWLKIKRHATLHCVIIGFIPKGGDDFKSLLVAADLEGGLRYAGRVGSGIDDEEREQLNVELRRRVRETPLVPCDEAATWVEPGLYCVVRYLEQTPGGMLRGPSLKELIVEP